jgi:hypothetical protein
MFEKYLNPAVLCLGVVVCSLLANFAQGALVIGGTATFTFDESLSGAATPLSVLDSVYKGTQSRTDVINGIGADPFDSVVGSQKTVTFSINGSAPATIAGRPNNGPTTLDYTAGDLFNSWSPGADLGAFVIGGEQIGIQSMTRWTGAFGTLIFGDFAIRYAPGRTNATRSGLVLTSNIDFADAAYADLANITTSATGSALTISGDLLYSDGIALLTGDPADVGVKFGTFQINAITAVPEPSSVLLVVLAGAGCAIRSRKRLALRFAH